MAASKTAKVSHHVAIHYPIPQGVVYKDTDFLAIDKPMGWTVNPGTLGY